MFTPGQADAEVLQLQFTHSCSHSGAVQKNKNCPTLIPDYFASFIPFCDILWWLIHEQDCLSRVAVEARIRLMFEGVMK